MTVPKPTANRRSPEEARRDFVPVREIAERLLGGLPSTAAAERLGRADPIQDWEAHATAPHSAAHPAPAPAEIPGAVEAEAPDGLQLSLALDDEARPDWPAVRYFEDRGLHHRHWKAARRVPWLQLNAENSLAAFAYLDVAEAHYRALLADWLPPATWTVVDGRGRLSVAWALRRGVHWNPASWAWRRRKARTIDQELALGLGAAAQIGRNIDAPIPRRLHANPAASPSPWRRVSWTGERYRLRHLDRRAGRSTIVIPDQTDAATTGRAVGGRASGQARQVIAAERRAVVGALLEGGLESTREIAAVVEIRTGRKVHASTITRDRQALGSEIPIGEVILDGVREGHSDAYVAHVIGCSPRTVQRHRLAAGIERPKGGDWR